MRRPPPVPAFAGKSRLAATGSCLCVALVLLLLAGYRHAEVVRIRQQRHRWTEVHRQLRSVLMRGTAPEPLSRAHAPPRARGSVVRTPAPPTPSAVSGSNRHAAGDHSTQARGPASPDEAPPEDLVLENIPVPTTASAFPTVRGYLEHSGQRSVLLEANGIPARWLAEGDDCGRWQLVHVTPTVVTLLAEFPPREVRLTVPGARRGDEGTRP